MELTNNEVERLIRGWVLDRKTWMFCGHDRSARCAAKALTLIATCQKMDIEPRAYIRWALRKILAGQTDVAVIGPEAYLEQTQH